MLDDIHSFFPELFFKSVFGAIFGAFWRFLGSTNCKKTSFFLTFVPLGFGVRFLIGIGSIRGQFREARPSIRSRLRSRNACRPFLDYRETKHKNKPNKALKITKNPLTKHQKACLIFGRFPWSFFFRILNKNGLQGGGWGASKK